MSSDKAAAGGFQFPACWSDDVRMGALFAQPRSENVNPQVSECFEGVGLLFCLFVFFGCLIFHEDTLTPRTGSASTNSGAKRSPLGRPITTSCWWTSTNSSRPSGAKERRRLAFNAFSKRWPSQKSCLDLSPVVELNGPFLFVSFLFCVLVEDGGNCWRRASAKDWRTLRVGRPGASAWSRRRWPGPGTKSRARSSKSNDNCPVMS